MGLTVEQRSRCAFGTKPLEGRRATAQRTRATQSTPRQPAAVPRPVTVAPCTAARCKPLRAAATSAPPTVTPATVTPKQLGYHMPGEFEKHQHCWMGWPDSPYLWRENAKPAQEQYAAVAKAISQFEPLIMLTNPECIVLDDPKTGSRKVAGTHWDFNSYGGELKKAMGIAPQVPDWSRDNAAGRAALQMAGLEVFESALHLEGGSIHVDGEGTLIATEETLLHPSRNPHLTREQIEDELKEFLGLEKVIWLWKGMAGDDAVVNGHVDNLACFIRPGVVALSWCDDVNDPQYERSTDAYERLTSTPDAKGRKIEVIKVPCPPPLFRTYKEASGVHPDHVKLGYVPRVEGERLPASYINHYIANGGAVIPQFGGPGLARASETDAKALEVLQAAYGSERKVVSVKSREILLNAGNIHCITQQCPAAQ